jgi:NifU-like protein involved in Fe-S cluster formation
MACASALTELVAGRSVEEARTLQRDPVIAAVGGVPPASTHAVQLALDALQAALAKIKS